MRISDMTERERSVTLFVVVSMSFLATLDSSIVNIALPSMSRQLNAPLSAIEWVIAGYSIMICAALLFFGRLGDMIGKAKVFQFGVAVFTLASLFCGFSSSLPVLVLCRVLQGFGASAYMANNQGLITELYPRQGRGRALGVLIAAVALGMMIGPPLGGLIVSMASWNWIFLIKVPLGVVLFFIGRRCLPFHQRQTRQTMDVAGSVLQFIGTCLLFAALIAAQSLGFASPLIWISLIVSAVLIGLFLVVERLRRAPLLDLRLFGNSQFSIGILCALIAYVCMAATLLLWPFYLQDTLELSAGAAGFMMMFSPLIIAVLSPFFGHLSDRFGSEMLTLVGLTVLGVSFLLMACLRAHTGIGGCLLVLAVMSVGQALFQPPNNSLIMSACPADELGIAGSVNSLVRNLGQMIGITLATTCLYDLMSLKLHRTVTSYVFGRDDVFVFGMRGVYLMLVAIAFLGAVLTAYRLIRHMSQKRRAQSAAAR
ncbi:MAG: MFS transporter [Sporolactobacillus sp.]